MLPRTFAEIALTNAAKQPDASSGPAHMAGGASWKTVLRACRMTLTASSLSPSRRSCTAVKTSFAQS